MKKRWLCSALLVCAGCGGGGSNNGGGGPAPAAIAGKWEIISSSTQNPGGSFPYAAIEINLAQTESSVFSGAQATVVIPLGAQGISWPFPYANPCGGLPQATMTGTLSGRNLAWQ